MKEGNAVSFTSQNTRCENKSLGNSVEDTGIGVIENEEKITNCIKEERLRCTVRKNSHCRLECYFTVCHACFISNRRGRLNLQENQPVD